MLIFILTFLASCSSAVDPCDGWTWIDEEWCAMDVCAEQGAASGECRGGACWCCQGSQCWEGR